MNTISPGFISFKRHSLPLIATILLALPLTTTKGGTFTWDAGGASPAAPVSASGTWNTTNAFWSNGTSDSAWDNSAGNTAVFGGSSGVTVTLSGSISVGGLISNNTSSATLASGTIYLAGGASTTFNASVTSAMFTINSNIAGTGGLTLTGPGYFAFGGTSTYTGTTTISSGQLRIYADNTLPASTDVLFSGTIGSSMMLYAHNLTIASLSGTKGSTSVKNVTTGTSTLTINGSLSTTYAGAITDNSTTQALNLVIGGSTFLTLTNSANNYHGTTTINSGTLQIGSGGIINNTSGVFIAGGEFRYNSNTALSPNVMFTAGGNGVLTGGGTINGTVSGTDGTINGNASGLTLNGATTLYGHSLLKGYNKANGGVTIAGGTTTLSGTTTGSINLRTGATLMGSGIANGAVSATTANINGSGISMGATTMYGNSTLAGYNIASGVTIVTGTTSLTGTTKSTSTLAVSSGATLNNNGVIDGSASVSGLLKGAGSITGELSVTSGTLAPGDGIGLLTVNGNLGIDSNSTTALEITGATAGTNHDQIKVSGNVTLAGTLDLTTLGGLSGSDTITLIDNTGTLTTTTGYFSMIIASGTTYTFSSASETNTIAVNGIEYLLNYASSAEKDGVYNDVTLSVVPEPGTWAMVLSGLGMLGFMRRLSRRENG